jgi:hypothetical protein
MARRVPTKTAIKKAMAVKKTRAPKTDKPPKFYVEYVDSDGSTIDKGYASKGGYEYAVQRMRNQGIKVEDHGAYGPKGKKVSNLHAEGPVMKGPIDMAYSQMSEEKTRTIVQSNFHPIIKRYTSRLYGGLNGMMKVVEPDGNWSLSGQKIVKKTDKETGIRTLTDGRTFTAGGWPVME